jgi:ankyrin repeat protein
LTLCAASLNSRSDSGPAAYVNEPDPDGVTPLEHAVQHQQDEAAAAIVKAGGQVDLADSHGLTGLMRAASVARVADVRRWLELGASIELQSADEAGQTALHFAAGSRMLQRSCIEVLLGAGAAPNLRSREGKRPLQVRRPPCRV